MSAQEPNDPKPAVVDETLSSSGPARRRVTAAPGEVLVDRYEVVDELGRGAFGIVYRAHDRVSDTTVAIKLLTGASTRSVETVARLRRELQAAWKVTHPGVVRVHDLIDLGNRLALLMELVDGETLDERLLRVRLGVDELTDLALDLARALAAAHRAGVTHRDLKPSNIIMRRESGRPVITDFGLSLIPGMAPAGDDDRDSLDIELTRSGGLCGTPRYMAPEQLAGQAEVTPAADVYALGLVLYEAATGQRPFAETNLAQLKAARRDRPAPSVAALRHDLPPLLARVIDRCLERDPAARYASAVEVRAALEPLRDRASSTGERRWMLAAAALAALVLVGAGAAALWTRLLDRLPAHDRKVMLTVEPEDELGRIAQAMAQHRLARDRHLGVTGAREANVHARLKWRRLTDGAALVEVDVGARAHHLAPLGQAQARSLSEAVDRALALLRAKLDEGQPERPPGDDERALATAAGAPDIESLRAYQAIVDETYSELIIDVPKLAARTEALTAKHPAWLHPYAQLINTEGGVSAAAQATLERARAAGDRDPVGRLMVEAAAETDPRRLDALIPRLDHAFATTPDDILLGWILYNTLHTERRVDESLAVLRTLVRVRPDLQFGSDLQQELRRAGRAGEMASFEEAWLRAAPDNQQALASQIVVDLEGGKRELAATHARDLLFLYGPSPQRLVLLTEVLIIAGELREAASLAEQLLRGNEYDRALAWFHLGQIALLQGRITAAMEAWSAGAQASRPFAVQGPLFQTLEELASTAEFVGAEAELAAASAELEKLYASTGDAAQALAWRIERDGRRGKCPDLPAALAGLARGAVRGSSQRLVVRAAAAVGCLPCAESVKLGMAPVENNVRSLLQLGVCAERTGQLGLAVDVLERARPLRELGIDDGDTPSTVASILAGYHLARVLERQGRASEADGEYRRFLARWEHGDREIAEVETARAARGK